MSTKFENQGPLNSIEQTLAGFAPAAPRLDRERLMFLAGQASISACGPLASSERDALSRREKTTRISGRQWLWPASTAALAATSLALAIALLTRQTPQPQLIVRDQPAPVQPPMSDARPQVADARAPAPAMAAVVRPDFPRTQGGYLKTRSVVLRMGLDGLGAPSAGSGGAPGPATYADLLKVLAGAASGDSRESANERSPTM